MVFDIFSLSLLYSTVRTRPIQPFMMVSMSFLLISSASTILRVWSDTQDHSMIFRNLEWNQFVKYLGVMIESNLSWNDHVAHLAFKRNKTIRIIARLRQFLRNFGLSTQYLQLPYHPYNVQFTSLTILSMQFHYFCDQILFLLICSIIDQ